MNIETAIQWIQKLADSRDGSGQSVSRADLIEDEECIEALRFAEKLLWGHLNKNAARGGSASGGDNTSNRGASRSKGGFAWTDADEELLASGFDRGASIEELAAQLNRSPSSIYARLMKLGKAVEA